MRELHSLKRRKIRGNRKRIRQVIRWQRFYQQFGIKNFDQEDRYYIRFWIHPWYSLFKPNPPVWLKKKMLQSMIEVAIKWNETLKQRGKPFDLQMWIHEKEFARTELLATQDTRIKEYQDFFSVGTKALKPIPPEYKTIPGFEKLEWHSKRLVNADFLEEWTESLLELPPLKRAKKENSFIRKFTSESGNEFVEYDMGSIWVGRLK